jgi:hypothetical protein
MYRFTAQTPFEPSFLVVFIQQKYWGLKAQQDPGYHSSSSKGCPMFNPDPTDG